MITPVPIVGACVITGRLLAPGRQHGQVTATIAKKTIRMCERRLSDSARHRFIPGSLPVSKCGLRTYPPSGVRSPSSPSGRKTRIRIRIENTIDWRPVGAGRHPAERFVELLDQPDDDRAEHGAGQVPDPAQHGCGEGDQAEPEALVELDVRGVERVEHPGDAGERAGDQERERDRPVHVDPHHRGGVLVLGRRAHRLSLLRALDEPHQHQQHGDGGHADDQLVPGVGDAVPVEDRVVREDVRQRDGRRPEPVQPDVLEDERHPDRRDQRRQSRRVTERPVRDPFDPCVERRAERHRAEQGHEQRRDHHRPRVHVTEPEPADRDREGHPRAEHEHVAVREVDQLEDPVDERVAERDQGVDETEREPVQERRRKCGRLLDEVHDEPHAHHPHEEQPDRVDQREPRPAPERGDGLGAHSAGLVSSGGGLSPSPRNIVVPSPASMRRGRG